MTTIRERCIEGLRNENNNLRSRRCEENVSKDRSCSPYKKMKMQLMCKISDLIKKAEVVVPDCVLDRAHRVRKNPD